MLVDLARLLEDARRGDADAQRELVERAGLRVARVAMGDSAKDKFDALRELERGEGAAPGLGVLLAGIVRVHDDGEIRRAIELVIRSGSRRWGPPERAVIGAVVETHGARLGAELALNLVEWAAGFPDDVGPVVRGVAPALAAAGTDEVERFGWHRGFWTFVIRERERVAVWTTAFPIAKQVAKALFSAQADRRPGAVDALAAIWERAPDRAVWVAALAEQTRSSYGMSHRDEIVAWSWRRFCEHDRERTSLYRAFKPWRDLWIEQRNQMTARERPGGASAVAHLRLWAGLDLEHLSSVVEEVKRLARDDEWAELVDLTFDLAIAAPRDLQRHALAGACRIASEVANRIRGGATTAGLHAGGDRVIARGEALARELRESGAVLDEIVSNRAGDLELEARLIREHRELEAERARQADESARAAAAREVEHARRLAEAAATRRAAEDARRAADEARAAAEIEIRLRLAASAPAFVPQPIDEEVFFSSLPAPSLLAYARMYKQMSSGGMQSLTASGVSVEMIVVINQTWASLFSQRPELAMRFSVLISSHLT